MCLLQMLIIILAQLTPLVEQTLCPPKESQSQFFVADGKPSSRPANRSEMRWKRKNCHQSNCLLLLYDCVVLSSLFMCSDFHSSILNCQHWVFAFFNVKRNCLSFPTISVSAGRMNGLSMKFPYQLFFCTICLHIIYVYIHF